MQSLLYTLSRELALQQLQSSEVSSASLHPAAENHPGWWATLSGHCERLIKAMLQSLLVSSMIALDTVSSLGYDINR